MYKRQAGIGLIAFSNKEGSSAYVLLGNALTFVSALFYTLQVVFVDRFSRTVKDPMLLLTVELFVIGSLFSVLMGAEKLTITMGSGFAIIFVATLISELKPDFNKLLKRNRGFIGAETRGASDAPESKGDKNMLYEINNGTIKLTVSSLGAEMTGLVKGGKERLWQNDNGKWAGHAPILFPACGNCALTTKGKKYPMIQHSFGPVSYTHLTLPTN